MSGYNNAIGWCDVTWPVIIGCFHKSDGCDDCWAERTAIRCAKPGQKYHGLVVSTPKGPKWTGKVRFWEPLADYPLRLRRPSRIFVCDTGDLFHERVPDEWVDRVFAVMALAPEHVFQVLTKRPERMRAYLAPSVARYDAILRAANTLRQKHPTARGVGISNPTTHPLRNIWCGTSVENQTTTRMRIADLVQIDAAVRFLSVEPLLEPVDLGLSRPEWVVLGCESRGTRPGRNAEHYADHARTLIEQCAYAGVPVYHKQMPVNGLVSHDPAEWPAWARVREFPPSPRVAVREGDTA